MAVTISLTESQVFTALRTVLLGWLTSSVEIVRAQQNRVPEPTAADFVVMLPVTRERISTNVVTFSDGFASSLPSTRSDAQPTKYSIQLDVHGPNSANNSTILSTLFRSDVACDAFAATGYDVTPLYSADPRQLPFIDAEQQFEDRWTFDVALQANIIVTSPQDFAGTVTVSTTSATTLG
jgi:hypothetical protein